MNKFIKAHRGEIKNILLILCLLVLVFQFKGAFTSLVDLVEDNEVYIETTGLNSFDLSNIGEQKEHIESYVKTSTLKIYTYKLFQVVLLLIGVFMCIVFLAINNIDFSLIKLAEENK